MYTKYPSNCFQMFKVYGNKGKAINHIDKKDFKEKKVEKSFKYCGLFAMEDGN